MEGCVSGWRSIGVGLSAESQRTHGVFAVRVQGRLTVGGQIFGRVYFVDDVVGKRFLSNGLQEWEEEEENVEVNHGHGVELSRWQVARRQEGSLPNCTHLLNNSDPNGNNGSNPISNDRRCRFLEFV